MRGQMTLSILTRLAMLFFIGALAAILFTAANSQKDAICRFQGGGLAFRIADQINQVLNSPLEDERKVFPLDIALSVGGERTLAYEVAVNKTQAAEGFQRLVFVVQPPGYTACEGAFNIPVDNRFTIHMPTEADSFMRLKPSSPEPGEKTFALVIMKCRSKSPPFDRHLILYDCKQQAQDKCPGFEDYAEQCQFTT